EALVAAVEACPRVLCHLDVWPVNMFERPDALVLADWAFAGDGALGGDLGNLIPDSLFDGVVRTGDVPGFAEELVGAYLAGLGEAGWHGDPDAVRRAVAAAAAAKYTWLAPRMLGRLAAGQPLRTSFYDPDSSDEEVLQRRRPVLELLAGWADGVPWAPASARAALVVARDVDVARSEGTRLARVRVVRVPPDAARVVGEQVDRDGGLGGGRPDAVDVVPRRDQDVEVAWRERALLEEVERPLPRRVDPLLLL